MRKFRIILLAGVTAMAICGCKDSKESNVPVTTSELITQAATEAPTEEITTEVATTESAASGNTEKMEMLLSKQEGDLTSKYLDKLQIDDEVIFAVPKSGTESSSNNMLEVMKEGVSVKFEINPKARTGKTETPVYECLRTYVEEFYDGQSDYEDVEISSIEDLSEDSARNVVTYVDSSGSASKVCEATWYLFDLHDEKSLMLCVTVNHSDTDNDSDNIVMALEDYYEIEVQYDTQAAKEKLAETTNVVTFKNITFELPANWKIDNTMTDNDIVTYAPNGSIVNSLCGITLQQGVGVFDGDASVFVHSKDELIKSIEDASGYQISNFVVTEIGNTILGSTAKVTYEMSSGNLTQKYLVYYGVTSTRLSMFAAFGMGDNFDMACDVLDGAIN